MRALAKYEKQGHAYIRLPADEMLKIVTYLMF
jgi:hypothetical protein